MSHTSAIQHLARARSVRKSGRPTAAVLLAVLFEASADVFEHEWARMPPPFSDFCHPDSVHSFLQRRLLEDPDLFSVWARCASPDTVPDLADLLTHGDPRWKILLTHCTLPAPVIPDGEAAITACHRAAALIRTAMAHGAPIALAALQSFVAWSAALRDSSLNPDPPSEEVQLAAAKAVARLRATILNAALDLPGDSILLAPPDASSVVFSAVRAAMAPHALFNLPTLRRWSEHPRGRILATLLASDPTHEAARLRQSLAAGVLVGAHIKDKPGSWLLDVFLSAPPPFPQDLVFGLPDLSDHPVFAASATRSALRAVADSTEDRRTSFL